MARIALLAGSNGPPSVKLDNLRFVYDDVDRLAAVLQKAPASYDRIEIVPRGRSARDALESFETLASQATYGDSLLFYFSGHGLVKNQQLYLIWENTDLNRLVTTALPISSVKTVFANSNRAQARLMVLDCCRSGAAGELVFGKATESDFAEPLIEAAREGASVIIAACSKNAVTREIPHLKSGLLTHLLVSALSDRFSEADRDKDGLLSLSDFIGWCADETLALNRSNALSEPLEKPELYGEIRGDVFLTVHRLKNIFISVAGQWLFRPKGHPEAAWTVVRETPGDVSCRQDDEVYRLVVDSDVRDRELYGVAHLRNLPALREMCLSRCKNVTDAGLAHLQGLVGLKSLDLKECDRVTDAGLAHLQGLVGLKSLNLMECEELTDAGLAHLRGLTGLQSLSLEKCPRVTDAGVQELQKALHRCHVRR
jgi:hypothetical protein